MSYRLLLIILALVPWATGTIHAGAVKSEKPGNLAFFTDSQKNAKRLAALNIYPPRYQQPNIYANALPKQKYKGFTLIGGIFKGANHPDNATFFAKIKQSIDLIERSSPKIYALMGGINPNGRRVIAYSGRTGPASFVAWKRDYIVNITAANLDEDPAFENSKYTLSATLVHEMVGHGRQQSDGRVWAMYDWCGKSGGRIDGVVWQPDLKKNDSGLVEYEANLYARWFLETVRGTYPNLNEVPIRRYVKIVRTMQKRFPDWYDESKKSVVLLAEFEGHFRKVCPGLSYTPHPA